MWPILQETADMATITEEIFNEKLYFLWSMWSIIFYIDFMTWTKIYIGFHLQEYDFDFGRFKYTLLCFSCTPYWLCDYRGFKSRLDRQKFHLFSSVFLDFLFYLGFSFTDSDNSQDSGARSPHRSSTIPLSPTREYGDVYLQLCIWDVYLVFLMAVHVVSKLLLVEIHPPQGISI